MSQMWPLSLRKVLTVASSSSSAATMSPFWAVFCSRMTTKSPSQIAASTIESPCTSSMNRLPVPVRRSGSRMTSSTCCSAVMGTPAAMRPTSGTSRDAVMDSGLSCGSGNGTMVAVGVGAPPRPVRWRGPCWRSCGLGPCRRAPGADASPTRAFQSGCLADLPKGWGEAVGGDMRLDGVQHLALAVGQLCAVRLGRSGFRGGGAVPMAAPFVAVVSSIT